MNNVDAARRTVPVFSLASGFWLAVLVMATDWTGFLYAEVKLPALIGHHMVLQQGMPVRVWGQADPGETVTVEFRDQKALATADASGSWALYLKPLPAGGPEAMTITGKNRLVISDVLVGEVWMASGQSNMQQPVKGAADPEQEISNATYPSIRFFNVARLTADTAADDVEGSWEVCSPETVGGASAVGYYFSRHIHQKRQVPVGLIHSSWGGTLVQSWISRATLESEPAVGFVFDEWKKTLAVYRAAREDFDKELEQWKKMVAATEKQGQPPPTRPRPPAGLAHQGIPSGVFNAMVAPLTRYAIRGAIWYQGESDAPTHPFTYRRLFRLMIEDWRRAWGQGDFPFLFVQLANFRSPIGAFWSECCSNPASVLARFWTQAAAGQAWPVLRESQAAALALALRNTGMAVAIDIGDSDNIHAKNKQDVGLRLGLAARHLAYGEDIVHSGPVFRQLTTEDDRLRIWFDHSEGGLLARGGRELGGFKIAGRDLDFVAAYAKVEHDSVVVWRPEVKAPVAVRYAWEDDPASPI